MRRPYQKLFYVLLIVTPTFAVAAILAVYLGYTSYQ